VASIIHTVHHHCAPLLTNTCWLSTRAAQVFQLAAWHPTASLLLLVTCTSCYTCNIRRDRAVQTKEGSLGYKHQAATGCIIMSKGPACCWPDGVRQTEELIALCCTVLPIYWIREKPVPLENQRSKQPSKLRSLQRRNKATTNRAIAATNTNQELSLSTGRPRPALNVGIYRIEHLDVIELNRCANSTPSSTKFQQRQSNHSRMIQDLGHNLTISLAIYSNWEHPKRLSL